MTKKVHYRDGGELLGRIPRDSKQEFKVVKGVYWNIESIDIRLYKDDKATPTGIRLNLEEIKVLQEILEKVKQWE